MFKAAAVQMRSSNRLEENLAQLRALLIQAAGQGVQLLVLPENFAVFGAESQGATAERMDEITGWLSAACREFGVWIVAGSMPCLQRPDGTPVPENRVRASCLVFDDLGECRARYDKIHLFDVDVADRQASYRESAVFEPGDQAVVIDTPWGKLGLAICYDIRFPALFMRLQQAGADFVAVPAAFTAVTGAAHWETLLRARAIETQCFVIGAAQAGWHNAKRETWGHSLIADPWGRILAERLEATPGLAIAELNGAEQREIRARMPLLQHRRLC